MKRWIASMGRGAALQQAARKLVDCRVGLLPNIACADRPVGVRRVRDLPSMDVKGRQAAWFKFGVAI